METQKEKVVLAYSGGLDTSFCIKYLTEERNMEVYTAIANTGGFSEEELKGFEKKAYELGAISHKTLHVTEVYYQKCIRYLIFGNVLRNHTYPVSVSSERVFQASAVCQYAKSIGAKYVAHGSTGAGNDQIRFDLTMAVMAPEIKIIALVRELQLSREDEIAYLAKHGFEADWSKAKYSINKGLWGTSVGGAETLTSHKGLPEEAYPTQVTETEEKQISLLFEKGELVGINGKKSSNSIEAIRELEQISAPFGVGRDIHVGDTIIGIKGRVGFEAAAPILIIKGHQLLEKHTLTKWQLYWKDQLSQWYGMFVHEAMYHEPVMRNIEQFLESSQYRVSGTVHIKLAPRRYELLGCKSPYDMMNSGFGDYGEMNKAWGAEDVEGFTKILANQLKIFYSKK